MKTNITIKVLTILLLVSCKENKVTDQTISPPATEKVSTNKKEKTVTQKLKQNGAYAALFKKTHNDCSFITSEMLADFIQVNQQKITQESNNCTYILNEENDKSTRFHFMVEQWNNDKILKEIKTIKKNEEMFGSESTLTQYRISGTGDSYLSMHQDRMIRILNEASNTIIVLFYNPNIDPTEKDIEKIKRLKAEARKRAYAICNALLTNNK